MSCACAARLHSHNRRSFRVLQSRIIVLRSMHVAAVNWLPPHWKSRELSFFIFDSRHAAVLLLCISASIMGSSHHVFFSPRVQLDIHHAQTSMWLFHVRSNRSDVERRGGAGQERFQSKAAQCCEYAFARS